MENPSEDYNEAIANSFREITSSSKEEAIFFLESHNWNLDSAVSTFFDSNHANMDIPASSLPIAPSARPVNSSSPSSSPEQESRSPNYSPSQSPSRSRSPSPAPARPSYGLRSRGKKPAGSSAAGNRPRGGIRTLADLNRKPDVGSATDDDDDDDFEPQEYYTGGEKSGMLVQDPTRGYDAEGVFNQARNSGGVERPADYHRPSSTSRSFTGTGRLLSGETVPSAAPQPPQVVEHTVTLWRNGFTVDDGPLRRFEDPANASFLESIKNSECPLELEPADRRTKVHLDLMRREENYSEPEKPRPLFQGVGRTLGSSSDDTALSAPDPDTTTTLKTAVSPAMGLVVDPSSPTTSLQLRLADGTRMVSRFNLHHTIRDLRAFIDASRPGGERNYQLQTMGFPPKQLVELDQSIEQAGIANSVIIQKL